MSVEKKSVVGRNRASKVGRARLGTERTKLKALHAWKLEDAKARFSEVVRRARKGRSALPIAARTRSSSSRSRN